MMAGQTIRFACGECNVVFDLGLLPRVQWREQPVDEPADNKAAVTGCPFCGSAEVRAQHDVPLRV